MKTVLRLLIGLASPAALFVAIANPLGHLAVPEGAVRLSERGLDVSGRNPDYLEVSGTNNCEIDDVDSDEAPSSYCGTVPGTTSCFKCEGPVVMSGRYFPSGSPRTFIQPSGGQVPCDNLNRWVGDCAEDDCDAFIYDGRCRGSYASFDYQGIWG